MSVDWCGRVDEPVLHTRKVSFTYELNAEEKLFKLMAAISSSGVKVSDFSCRNIGGNGTFHMVSFSITGSECAVNEFRAVWNN